MRAVVGRERPRSRASGEVVLGVLVGACALAAGCWASSRVGECVVGESEVCDSPCGVGMRRCGEDGRWEACWPWGTAECLPGESGTCDLAEGDPPGLWTCRDDCTRTPCEARCMPGAVEACETACGPGRSRCGEDGTFGPCVEEVAPACRPGDVEACDEGGVSRCTAGCVFGPCEEGTICTPGEEATCHVCGVQRCLPSGTWGDCRAECFPGDVAPCSSGGGGYCGVSAQRCTAFCTWGPCVEVLNPPDEPGTP